MVTREYQVTRVYHGGKYTKARYHYYLVITG